MQKSMTDSSGEPYREALASGTVNAPKVAGGGPPDHPSSSSSSSSDDKKKSKKDKKKKKKKMTRKRSVADHPQKEQKEKQKGVTFTVRVTFIVELVFWGFILCPEG